MIALVATAFANTGFYVGKALSADGTTMIGMTVDDAPWNGPMREARFERGEWAHADGTTNRYAFICSGKVTSQGKGFCCSGAINEKGVMLSGPMSAQTNDAALEADPFVAIDRGGFGAANLPDILIGNAATARAAVEILGEKIAERGHSGSAIYMVADTDEAWHVEVYSGHQWAAVKMPENKVAVFGNQFNIREFDPNDTLNVMFSPYLIRFAVDIGLARWMDEEWGVVNLYATYSAPLGDYANYRTYWGHRVWAPTAFTYDPYATDMHYPLFFVPEPGKKIALTDIFELMRTRFEGVNCPDENGDTSIRVIGTTKQQSCHVLQMRHDLPEDYRCTLWECLAQAEHSTFLPICMAVKQIPDAYSRDQTGALEYDPDRAADAFLRLATLAELKRFVVDTYGNRQDVRRDYGAGVRAYWRAQEDRLVAKWPRLLEQWGAAEDGAGRTAATAYVNFNQVWTLADAKRLHDELAWYWAEFNCDLRDGEGARDVPTYPFASSVPTNSELGVAWTQWHRAEFATALEELAGAPDRRQPAVSALVDTAKHALDGVEDMESLNAAKAQLQGAVASLCEEVAKPLAVPVIASFALDFEQGPTSEVPTVTWRILGPFDQVTLTIDGKTVYNGDTRCGDGRWRALCRAGTHRLVLAVRHEGKEVSSSCFYTALLEEDEPVLLPRIDYFYPLSYVGQKGVVPRAIWGVRNITSLEIWVDGVCVHISEEENGEIRLSQLRHVGPHVVYMVAHNAFDDTESCFAYRTDEEPEEPETTLSLSAPDLQTVGSAPVIREFKPDAYEASIWETPFIRWELDRAVDSLQMVIDGTLVFKGDGRKGGGRWQDLDLLNIDASRGSHEVTLSVSNAFGVATSNFICTCYWAEPPPPPTGSEASPWQVGETVQAYTNGIGGLVFIGEGATYDFSSAEEVPWFGVADSIESVAIPETLTVIGRNLWAGLGERVVINGEPIARRKQIAAGFPVEAPAGEISGGEFGGIRIVNGMVQLTIGVYTNTEFTATTDRWGKAKVEKAQIDETGAAVLSIPAPADKGFMILKSKPAK